jgi:hypothetical protein
MSRILTSNGMYFPFDDPDSYHFTPEVIARALSRICRFTGHTSEFYSVAQHCVMASEMAPAHLRMELLMHDASEAFLGDVASPLKAKLAAYREIEHRVEHAIAKQFALPFPHPPEVKVIDLRMLATERRDLLPRGHRGDDWALMYKPFDWRIDPWPMEYAEHEFMQAYDKYHWERMSGRLS